MTPDALGRLICLVETGVVSGSAAKEVFERMYGTGKEPEAIVEAEGLSQIGDERELETIVTRVIAEHEDAVTRFHGGNDGSLGFLVGQVMRATKGRANPQLVSELLRRALSR